MSRDGGDVIKVWIVITLLAVSVLWLSIDVKKIKNHMADSGKTSVQEYVKK